MSIVRRAIAVVAVAGTLAIAPLTIVSAQGQQAGVGTTVSINGGQGGWPLRR